MKQTKILIYENDREYTEALTSFLVSREGACGLNFTVTVASKEGTEIKEGEFFDIALLSCEMPDVISQSYPDIKAKKTLFLTEEKEDDESRFFKYQNMEELLKIIMAFSPKNAVKAPDAGEKLRLICVYSPGGHELTMPFALSICRHLSKTGKTIFLDIEDISLLPKLAEIDVSKDLADLMYTIENEDVWFLEEYVTQYEGFDVLSPFASPAQLSYINSSGWEKLFECIKKSGYKAIVMLLDTLIQGFNMALSKTELFILVKKSGVFERLKERAFLDYVEMVCPNTVLKELHIPFSAQNLSEGAYRLSALINGSMLTFVGKELSVYLESDKH